jgi:hopanoid biosynthesis associated protein HpnK
MKRLIVTADDFGLALPVNEAVELAHREGILGGASLMVGAAYAQDAVERARRLPALRIGVHLVVAEGAPVLAPERLPNLVDENGELPADLVRAGIRFFFRRAARRELEQEITAQFEAFEKTGLPLDHVNVHNHMQLHPTVLSGILKVARRFGVHALRLPMEQPGARLLTAWVSLLRWRLRRAGIRFNDQVQGLSDSGAMTEERVLRLLGRLPEGVTEMYFHPATRRCPEIDRHMPEYQHEEELAALTSPKVRDAIGAMRVTLSAFSDL